MGYNADDEIRVDPAGAGRRRPTQPIPPERARPRSDAQNAHARYDLAAARALLDKFGYKDRDGDGFRELPDGKPLVLTMGIDADRRATASATSCGSGACDAIGIKIEFVKQKWPDLLKMARARAAADVAGRLDSNTTAEGVASWSLLYGPNAGQTNLARFKNCRVRRAVRASRGALRDGRRAQRSSTRA